MHNNLITINGQKMGKSLGNAISLNEIFSGNHRLLEKAYSPMVVRFFILQAHYRSTLDFSNRAIQASEKGLERLSEGMETLKKIKPATTSTYDPEELSKKCQEALDDDLNTPVLISHLFEGVKQIHLIASGKGSLTGDDLQKMKDLYNTFVYNILGVKPEEKQAQSAITEKLVNLLLDLRQEAKKRKDFDTADRIRAHLLENGIEVKDIPGGYEWQWK